MTVLISDEGEDTMLYKLSIEENVIEPMSFKNFGSLSKKEKDLENLLAMNLEKLFIQDNRLMTIFQERARQEEPDVCALDKDGNLIIFELKRGGANEDAVIQIMRYSQKWGKMSYYEIEEEYRKYCEKNNIYDQKLVDAHQDAFGLDNPLNKDMFNLHQKLIIIGSSSDIALMEAVDYWRKRSIDIDFVPYRIYEIDGNHYFEFFSKPYDIHTNPSDRKGILFDTNRSYDEDAILDMLRNNKVSAYGSQKDTVKYFNINDFVLYYHKGWGVVAAGIIKSETKKAKRRKGDEELYRDVQLITPPIGDLSQIHYISYSELQELLKKNFFLARTAKVPYLSEEESKKVIDCLNEKYSK